MEMKGKYEKSDKKNRITIGKEFLLATILLLGVEIFIAIYGKGFIRNYLGDVLAVLFIYCFIRIFSSVFSKLLPLYVFLFAVWVEIMQALDIVDKLYVGSDTLLAVTIGRVFDWKDILFYAAGSLIAYILEITISEKKRRCRIKVYK